MSSRRILTLYSSPKCTLCKPVHELLERTVAENPLTISLVVVDITKDRAAASKFVFDIPVVELDGVEIARHRLTAEILNRAIDRQ